ncbi:MAG: (d)CMP kinase [Thermomicrobiales bacterium]|nr:(d)CMP kinase [Thermomicrobiales bacterium]
MHERPIDVEHVDHRYVIAIDGPAAAGKTTVARRLADRIGALLFDTGALYRAVALIALQTGVAPTDAIGLAAIARSAAVEVRPPSCRDGRLYDVWLDGRDITWDLRAPEVGAIVSEVAEHREVREALLPLQRKIASGAAVVMVGRDIGTVVVPDAGLKIYLDASPEERARRRFREAALRGGTETLAEVARETMHRDQIDRSREAAPLRAAPDAERVFTDNLEVDDVVAIVERLARDRHIAFAESRSRS